MSNDKHTPTPWHVEAFEVYDTQKLIIADCGLIDDLDIVEANAARIVQCVNACEGMGDPEMVMRVMRGVKVKSSKLTDEGVEITFDTEKAIEEMNAYSETIATLRAEKAELIEALRSILEANESEDLVQVVYLMNGIASQTLAKIETK
jgi:hypothetical protein